MYKRQSGTPGGLTTNGNYSIAQGTGSPGASEVNDRFAESLASGDINGDGLADVLVGVPGEAIGSRKAAGNAIVLYGDCLLYTSDAADERSRVDLGGPRNIKKKNTRKK